MVIPGDLNQLVGLEGNSKSAKGLVNGKHESGKGGPDPAKVPKDEVESGH